MSRLFFQIRFVLLLAMLDDSFSSRMAVDMGDQARASEQRFTTYVESLTQALDHADRTRPLKD
jgi:hypothetical protein